MDRMNDAAEMETTKLLNNARRYVEIEGQAVMATAARLEESFVEVAGIISSAKGKVFVTGAGTSSFIARRMAHLMSVSGTPAVFVHAMDALHGTMGAIEQDDVLIGISKSGESDEVCQLAAAMKDKNVRTIGLTEGGSSRLSSIVDVVCLLSTPGGADPGNFIAMGSTLVAAVWGDALARTLMDIRGWQLEGSLDLHPAGGVGKRAEELRLRLRGGQ